MSDAATSKPAGDALFHAMSAVSHVAKDSQGHGYKYRGIEAIMQAARPALRAAMMSCYPIAIEVLEREARASSRGASLMFTMVRVTFRYASPDESFDVQVIGEAFDSGDKGMAKAISVAQRTAHILALQIPTGEDTEAGEQHAQAATSKPVDASKPHKPGAVETILATKSVVELEALRPRLERLTGVARARAKSVYDDHRATLAGKPTGE